MTLWYHLSKGLHPLFKGLLECGSQLVGCDPFRVGWPFHRGWLRSSENIDIYSIFYNSSKITSMK